MSGDALFPFPVPDFIFVHDVYLFAPSDLVKTTDERGKTKTVLPAKNADGTWPKTPVKGYLTGPDQNQDYGAFTHGEAVAAVCLLPNEIGVDIDWLLDCHDLQLPPDLAGTFQVLAVRPNVSHSRVMVKRFRHNRDEFGGGA